MLSPWLAAEGENESPLPIYQSQDNNRDYYRQVLGSVRDQETDRQVYEAFHLGPEQTAVYSREFAQSSAACCPYGCFEGSIRRAKIDELIEMEREAAESVHQANLLLLKARRLAVRWEQNFDEDDEDLHLLEEGQDGPQQTPTIPEESVEGMDALEDSRKSCSSPVGSTEQKSDPLTPPTTGRKEARHRRKPTFETMKFPEDMNLEAELFAKAASEGNRLRADSASGSVRTANANDPGTAKTKALHRSKPSLESMQLPGSLGLEAQLFKRANSGLSARKPPSHRRQHSLESANLSSNLGTESDGIPRVFSDQDLSNRSCRDFLDVDNAQSSNFEKGMAVGSPRTARTHSRKPTLESIGVPEELVLDSDPLQGTSASSNNSLTVADRSAQNANFMELLASQNLAEDSAPGHSSAGALGAFIDFETPKIGNLGQSQPLQQNLTDEEIRQTATEDRAETTIDIEAGEGNQNFVPRDSQWTLVQGIVANVSQSDRSKSRRKKKNRHIASGAWVFPSLRSIMRRTKKTATKGPSKVVKTVTDTAIDALDIQRESSYAVVTFTSRQAAVAARHCLADGRGTDRWVSSPELPIPPLADAASGDILACRNCCKPVTLSIDDRQKDYRKVCALALLGTIYVFYTIPLTAAARLVDPQSIKEVFPKLSEWLDENWGNGAELISGLLQSSIWTLFFALCPVMFRAISNFGSGATSAADSEYKALIYFWYFMTISAFSTTLISNMFLSGLNNGRLGGELREVIREIARTIPSVQAVTWLNWIIFRFTILLPVNYLLNLPAFLFTAIDFRCCARIVMGGGPGTPTPYRIYVDSGIVLLCLMALAPASPLVAPACFAYYLIFQPILRRNLIYMYRPRFDGGGFRWPLIFDMCISCVVVGQILLTTQMILKQALGPAIAAACPILPTLLFHRGMRRKYLRSFEDAALLQTSMLDGWDSVGVSSMEKREEFRRFLVDAHKAAYIPVCIASGEDDEGLTAEPAVVVPLETDVQKDLLDEPLHSPYQSQDIVLPDAEPIEVKTNQHGATLRRAVNSLAALRRRAESTGDSQIFESMKNLNVMPEPSPFDRRATLSSTSSKRAAFHRLHDDQKVE